METCISTHTQVSGETVTVITGSTPKKARFASLPALITTRPHEDIKEDARATKATNSSTMIYSGNSLSRSSSNGSIGSVTESNSDSTAGGDVVEDVNMVCESEIAINTSSASPVMEKQPTATTTKTSSSKKRKVILTITPHTLP